MLSRILRVLATNPGYAFSRAINLAFPQAAKCASRLPSLLTGKGLEVGGPSKPFESLLGIYKFADLDNCNFHAKTIWEGEISEGRTFRYGDKIGKQFIREASDLRFPDNSYDFIISSHMLEHSANPVKVLLEWRRVLRSYLLLVLPEGHKTITTDRRRPITPLEHMISDYRRGVGEDDLTHTDDKTNVVHRTMHHHVFSEETAVALTEYCGFRTLFSETVAPFHIVILSAKP